MISIAPSSTFLRRSVHLKVRNLFPPYPLDATPATVLLLLNKTGNNDKNATDGWENVADSRLYTRYIKHIGDTKNYGLLIVKCWYVRSLLANRLIWKEHPSQANPINFKISEKIFVYLEFCLWKLWFDVLSLLEVINVCEIPVNKKVSLLWLFFFSPNFHETRSDWEDEWIKFCLNHQKTINNDNI